MDGKDDLLVDESDDFRVWESQSIHLMNTKSFSGFLLRYFNYKYSLSS